MSTKDWLEIARIAVDLLKALLPYLFAILLIILFRKELKDLIKKGGKFSVSGMSIESAQKQADVTTEKQSKIIETLNNELQTAREREKKARELQENISKDKDNFFLAFHFERTYRLIFPSQMVILIVLKNTNAYVHIDLARSIFIRTIWHRDFHSTFEQFIGFLSSSGLIEQSGEKIRLSPLGKVYMQYLEDGNIPLKVPANDVFDSSQIPQPPPVVQ